MVKESCLLLVAHIVYEEIKISHEVAHFRMLPRMPLILE